MPTIVTASEGDTLCGLAIAAGFLDCAPVRAEPANSAFLTRDLHGGDQVTIPDLQIREEAKSVEALHSFVAANSPPVSIRFVHGSPNKKYRLDDTLTVLNVSNYNSIGAGRDGRTPFPQGFEFQQPAHDDPDTFKVEVVDPAAGGTVNVVLEAMKPVYRLDPVAKKPVVDHHEPFTGAPDAEKRKVTIECKQVRSKVAFRSKYLRLVVDERDWEAISDQALLVTDIADGNGTGQPDDKDTVEILDQRVRASYVRAKCPAADPNKCTVRADLPIGEDPLRVRMAFHVFRTARGGAAVRGLTKQHIQRRVFKWFRRYYAQASMGPKLVGPGIDFVDPPDENMLVISQDTGKTASGKTAAGITPSTLDITIFADPLPFGSAIIHVRLTKGMTPIDVGEAVVEALPGGLQGEIHENPRAFNARHGSCDVIVTSPDGARVTIDPTTDDTGLQKNIAVARVRLDHVDSKAKDQSTIPSTIDLRRLIYAAPTSDDRLDVLLIADDMTTARGIAFFPAEDLKEQFRPIFPLRNCAVIAAQYLDGSDDVPAVLPHEAGHILGDVGHVADSDPLRRREIMSPDVLPDSNLVNAPKRLCDVPLLVTYAVFDPAQPSPGAGKFLRTSSVKRFRERSNALTEAF